MAARTPDGGDRVTQPSPEPQVPPGWPSDDALPVHGWGSPIDVPVEELWTTFSDVATWSRWNPCISWARIGDDELQPGTRLTWVFGPIRRWFPYRMPAIATITEVIPGRRVTWEVTLPGFHALHSYLFEDAGEGRSRFGSWEIARGWIYRLARRFWLAHFRYVCEASIAGAAELADRRVRLIERRVGSSASSPGSSPAIVVLPGVDGRPEGVDELVASLARTRPVFVVDYSREIESSLADLADAVAALLPDTCDLVGHSFGTWIAAEVARRRPQAVRRVVLVAPFTEAGRLTTRVRWVATRLTPAWINRQITPADDPSDRSGTSRRIRWQLERDGAELLAGIDQPVVVVLADRGRLAAPHTELAPIASIFSRPRDRVVVVDDAAEAVLAPATADAIAKALGEFLV